MTNSRAKGCRGEIEFAKELGFYGINAIRGQQKYGSSTTPDVVHNLPAVHFEVKRNEKMAVGSKLLEQALEQALGDCAPDRMACVVWKKSRAGGRLRSCSPCTLTEEIFHLLRYQ